MPKCIYCLKEPPEIEFTKKGEHVIPKAFGKFGSKTPLLKNVCYECNQDFGKKLDFALSRDSLEGMERYRQGISSSASNHPHKRVIIQMAPTERPKGVPDMRFRMDGSKRKLNIETGVRLLDNETKKEIVLAFKEVSTFDINPWLNLRLDGNSPFPAVTSDAVQGAALRR